MTTNDPEAKRSADGNFYLNMEDETHRGVQSMYAGPWI